MPCCSLSCLPSACAVAHTASSYHSCVWAPCPSVEGRNIHKTLHWATATPTEPLVAPVNGEALKCSGFAALAHGFGIRQAAPSGPAGRAAALLPGWAPLAGTHPQTLPRLLPPAGLPKQHVRSRLVSRAKPRLRVRLISHADLLCQGSDPVLVRKQTHCDILGSDALSHPLGKPMLRIGRAGLEVLGHSVTIPLAAQSPWLIRQL